jgi:hypothetical protein
MTNHNPIEDIDVSAPPTGTGCLECDQTDGWWFHLRRCAGCGHIGCCDNSPSQHATRHAEHTGHRLLQSFEPGEDWYWGYQTSTMLRGPALAPPEPHPQGQSAPGPENRVPAHWQELLLL